MVPGNVVSNSVCCARYVERPFEEWLKSDGRSMACTKYLQKDLVDLKSCMKVV